MIDDIDERGYGLTRNRDVDAIEQRKASLYIVVSQTGRCTKQEVRDFLDMLGLIPDATTSSS